MLIAFDYANGSNNGSVGFSYNHTCASNSYLLVCTTVGITAVTYDSVSLTLLDSYTPSSPPGTNCAGLKIWCLTNPNQGTHSVTTNAAGTAVSASYTGMSLTQPDVRYYEDSANNQVGSFTSNVTTVKDNDWMITFIIGTNNYPNTFTAGTGATLRVTNFGGVSSSPLGILDSGGAITPAGATSLTTNWSTGSGFITTITEAMQPITNGGLLDFFP